MSNTRGPAIRYYRSLVGSWSGPYEYTVTDRRALREAVSSLFLRLGTTSMSLASHLHTTRFSTTLDVVESGTRPAITHSTRVTSFGFLLFETTESIALDDDGRSFVMTGEQRARMGPPERYEARGEIDSDATSAAYRIPFMGRELVQKTLIVPEGLSLSQETAWSLGRVLLRRVGAPAA